MTMPVVKILDLGVNKWYSTNGSTGESESGCQHPKKKPPARRLKRPLVAGHDSTV